MRTDAQLARHRAEERRYYPRRREHQLAYWQEWADRPGTRERLAERERERRRTNQADQAHKIAREREWQAVSAAAATVFRAPWSAADDAVVMRNDLTLLEIALNLSRTYAAVKYRRSALRANTRQETI